MNLTVVSGDADHTIEALVALRSCQARRGTAHRVPIDARRQKRVNSNVCRLA